MNRRKFILAAAKAGLALSIPGIPMVSKAAGVNYDVIIVGGGMAGATIAKYLRIWSNYTLKVALIEKDTNYTSNIMSNEVLTGKRTVSSLGYAYTNLINKYGIYRIQATVSQINTASQTITYGATTLSYGALVLATGLEFDLWPGLTNVSQYDTAIPHAWKAGPQTTLLRNQLVAMTAGAGNNVVITIPKAPYRCPPGPYERACVIADWLRLNKPGSKVIVLDENPQVMAEKDNFMNAFSGAYGYTVDYRPGVTITNVSASPKNVTYTRPVGDATETVVVNAAVLNPIPPQRAPKLLSDAGLLNGGKFAPVDPVSFESMMEDNVYIIGDACNAGSIPKAGHIANQEAKTCASAILLNLTGYGETLALSPVLNSACYTPVTSTLATWLSAVYQYNGTSYVMQASHNGGAAIAAGSATTENYSKMTKWFGALMADTFS